MPNSINVEIKVAAMTNSRKENGRAKGLQPKGALSDPGVKGPLIVMNRKYFYY